MPEVIQPTEASTYRYDPTTKQSQFLASSDRGAIGVRVLKAGTKSQQQQYELADTFLFVKAGQLRVLGANNELLAEIGQFDGASLTANTPFVLEATGDSDTEVVQTFASPRNIYATIHAILLTY